MTCWRNEQDFFYGKTNLVWKIEVRRATFAAPILERLQKWSFTGNLSR
jgi:hypothetical protein